MESIGDSLKNWKDKKAPDWVEAHEDSSGAKGDIEQAVAMGLGIPPRFRTARLADFKPEDFKDGAEILSWKKLEQDVVIVGPNGVGKTHLAAALAREHRIHWLATLEWILQIRRSFKPGVEESEWSLVNSKVEIDRLVIDDVTAVSMTDFALASMLALINGRMDRLRKTVVTSFHGYSDLKEFDSSLASRIGGFFVVRLKGADRRHHHG
jgi:DNA replication protein DnaC